MDDRELIGLLFDIIRDIMRRHTGERSTWSDEEIIDLLNKYRP